MEYGIVSLADPTCVGKDCYVRIRHALCVRKGNEYGNSGNDKGVLNGKQHNTLMWAEAHKKKEVDSWRRIG